MWPQEEDRGSMLWAVGVNESIKTTIRSYGVTDLCYQYLLFKLSQSAVIGLTISEDFKYLLLFFYPKFVFLAMAVIWRNHFFFSTDHCVRQN